MMAPRPSNRRPGFAWSRRMRAPAGSGGGPGGLRPADEVAARSNSPVCPPSSLISPAVAWTVALPTVESAAPKKSSKRSPPSAFAPLQNTTVGV